MAFCAHCGNQLSDMAVSCPNCGHPTKETTNRSTAVGPVVVGEYASFGRRFLALLIDGLITSGVGFFGSYGAGVGFLYAWLMIALVSGQTVGKMALGIRITTPDGAPVDLAKSAIRAAMALVSGLALGLGYLWAAWDPEHRTWHDMVAETRAYRVPR